jgi:hypothetical protein
MQRLELDPSTTEGWAFDDAVQAEVERRLADAQALDAEIRAIVRARRLDRVRLCDRLARMRREKLHEPLNYGTFVEYAVAVGAATSHRAARQQADLAEQLELLPHLRGVFEAGDADWTKVREAAEVATPATDADLARDVVNLSYDEIRAKKKEALGQAPTRRISFELPLEVLVRFDQYVNSTGERLGQRLTKGEAFELMLETAARSEPCPRGQTQEPEQVPPDAGSTEVVDAAGDAEEEHEDRSVVASGRASRIPPPSATLIGYVCELCEETSVQGPDGPVLLSPARAALLACDAVVQEADGSRTRKIPPRIRAQVYARDRGTCRVPGCGAQGFLHEHHEGLGGWRETGHDPDKVVLTCFGHHTQRHKGLLRIEPLGGGQFRFVRSDGQELVAGAGANGTTTTTAPRAPRCPRGQESAAPESESEQLDEVVDRALARLELSPRERAQAVKSGREALAARDEPVTLEALVREALVALPTPGARAS